jgi:hypothetical protein
MFVDIDYVHMHKTVMALYEQAEKKKMLPSI